MKNSQLHNPHNPFFPMSADRIRASLGRITTSVEAIKELEVCIRVDTSGDRALPEMHRHVLTLVSRVLVDAAIDSDVRTALWSLIVTILTRHEYVHSVRFEPTRMLCAAVAQAFTTNTCVFPASQVMFQLGTRAQAYRLPVNAVFLRHELLQRDPKYFKMASRMLTLLPTDHEEATGFDCTGQLVQCLLTSPFFSDKDRAKLTRSLEIHTRPKSLVGIRVEDIMAVSRVKTKHGLVASAWCISALTYCVDVEGTVVVECVHDILRHLVGLDSSALRWFEDDGFLTLMRAVAECGTKRCWTQPEALKVFVARVLPLAFQLRRMLRVRHGMGHDFEAYDIHFLVMTDVDGMRKKSPAVQYEWFLPLFPDMATLVGSLPYPTNTHHEMIIAAINYSGDDPELRQVLERVAHALMERFFGTPRLLRFLQLLKRHQRFFTSVLLVDLPSAIWSMVSRMERAAYYEIQSIVRSLVPDGSESKPLLRAFSEAALWVADFDVISTLLCNRFIYVGDLVRFFEIVRLIDAEAVLPTTGVMYQENTRYVRRRTWLRLVFFKSKSLDRYEGDPRHAQFPAPNTTRSENAKLKSPCSHRAHADKAPIWRK